MVVVEKDYIQKGWNKKIVDMGEKKHLQTLYIRNPFVKHCIICLARLKRPFFAERNHDKRNKLSPSTTGKKIITQISGIPTYLFDEGAKTTQNPSKLGLMTRDEGLLQNVNYRDFLW